ncbi:PAS domain S-box protein [Phyllobacterium sp. CL33Tsu]|uniref:PAS domain S-box protein n=1 Tax=Phyllobacterium sp. CL33Tsu TaxID=1798191 RepID=UPI000B85952B|nr:PAS domain S-box protein [Phyllobacterium sp. CL33Tsu]
MDIPQSNFAASLEALHGLDSYSRDSIVMELPVAVYTTDKSGMLTFYNKAAAELWGRMPEIGKERWSGALRLYWPDGTAMQHDECPLATTLREEREVRDVDAIAERPDGSRIAFMPFPVLLRNKQGEIVGALNMLRDITEQRRDEAMAERLAAIVESSDDAIISKDLSGMVTTWNKAAERIFGYTAEDMIGRSITTVIPPDRLYEEPGIVERVRNGQRIDHYETVRQRKDGTRIHVSLTVSPVKNASGRVVGASKIARDITDKKESEERILMLMREVNHRVKNQYAVILSMIRETSSRTTDVVEFEQQIRERIMALARSHDLLVHATWRGATLSDLLLEQIKPFGDENRLTMTGPSMVLQPNAVQYLGIAFHELATNSAKYGVFSSETGEINVDWFVGDEGKTFYLAWTETGGPPVKLGRTRGFGKTVLERITPLSLGGEGMLEQSVNRIVWTVRAPMENIRAASV